MDLIAFCVIACESGITYIEVAGLNYTRDWIRFFIDEGGGDVISPTGGGGSFVCCVGLPKRWCRGMQATVRWQVDRPDRDIVHEKIVAVPKSEQSDIGFFAVHFYRDGSVKVLVTTKTDKHPAYPYQRPPS